MSDYYKILNVSRGASQDEIKKAYRRLAHKYHPDKKGGDEAKFKEINEAYQVLGNKEKRAQHDQFGTTFNGGPSTFSWEDFSGFQQGPFNFRFENFDFGDIFSDFFGNARARTREKLKGEDIIIDREITLFDVLKGKIEEIKLYKWISCPLCEGSGADPKEGFKECEKCEGAGRITETRRTFLGSFSSIKTCPECNGAGKIPNKKCVECRGNGRIKTTKQIRIKIPVGISDGEIIRVRGEGEYPEARGIPGDLLVRIYVKKDRRFERQGINLKTEISISFKDAVLGATKEIPTLYGSKKLKIPKGTQPGEVFQLSGKGLPELRGRDRGHHYIKVNMKVPKKLSGRQKKLLEEFDQEEKSFFGKIKKGLGV